MKSFAFDASRRRLLLGSILPLASPSAIAAPSVETGFLNRSVSIEGSTHRYQVYVPATYQASVAWPVILFLHGSGESGTDGVLQTEVGLGSALRRHPDRYPAIVVFPQTPSDKSGNAVTARIALAALDKTLREFSTDAGRVYLTGLSMGGSGAWYLAYQHPERFAALVPICGWVAKVDGESASVVAPGESPYEALAERLKRLPIWIHHGESDTVVPVEESRKAFAALKAAGGDVHYTEIAGGNHNAWDAAYQSEELPAWLLKMRLAEHARSHESSLATGRAWNPVSADQHRRCARAHEN